ncbi:hypothetical protein QJQ45_021824 [Haematococcus lacustris]|nr:hypothetical protein QJQ45_021824 [Haematococcus lacustris]
MSLVAEREVKGAVYEVLGFQQGKLLAAINGKVAVFTWQSTASGGRELVQECYRTGNVIALYLAARGDHVLVGDLMRSVSLLLYKPQEASLELRAQDFASNWTTAVAMLDDDTYLAAENSFNLLTVRKNPDAATDEDRQRLEPQPPLLLLTQVVGEFHVGEFINRIRPGSLVMRLPDSGLAALPTQLYGTLDGALGLLVSLPPPTFEFLNRLQEAMRKVVRGVGGLSHSEWRAWCNERKTSEARGFVDGDLVEMFLDLSPADASRVVALMGHDANVEDVARQVEELSRLH